jgi:hypothetical protein
LPKSDKPSPPPGEPADTFLEVVHDPATGRFTEGSGGRKRKGSRNKVTLAIENLFEGEGETIARKAIEIALAGDPQMMRLVLERVVPIRKGRAIPQIEVQVGESKFDAILRSVLEGELTPDEGQSVLGLIESAARTQVAYALEDQRRENLKFLKEQMERESMGSGGGVMLVPYLGSLKDWEEAARESQIELKKNVKK